MKLKASVVLMVSLLAIRPACPWWETGHRVVARLAAAHLTPAARTRVARVLDVPDSSNEVADALARASTWADETKKQTNTGAWHFIDLALQDRESDIPARCPNDNCAPARIRLFAAQLGSRVPEPPSSDLDALRYLVHFVGDIHEPLHTVSDADLGGNCEVLDPPIDQAKNLHALWDGPLVTETGTEAALTAELEQSIEKLSRREQRRLAAGSVNDWVWESHKLAIRVVYDRLRIPTEPVEFPGTCTDAPPAITEFRPVINTSYLDEMKPVIRMQLTKAGLRLAQLLNESL